MRFNSHRVFLYLYPMEECCNIEESTGGFYEELKGYINSKTGNIHDSEDLVQEVMLVLLNAYSNGTDIKNMRAWLYRVTKNILLNYFRDKKSFDSEQKLELEDKDHPEFDLILADYVFPMISLLDSQYRETMELVEIKGKSLKEVSKIQDEKLSTIKMRVKRGREKLRELIFQCCDVNEDQNGVVQSCQIKKECLFLYDLKKKSKSE